MKYRTGNTSIQDHKATQAFRYSTHGLAAVFLILGTLLGVGCNKGGKPESKAPVVEEVVESGMVTLTEAQVREIGLTTERATQRSLRTSIHVSGVLDVPPQNLVSVSAPFGGFLQSTPLLQGSRVQKGQQIALLQHPDFVTMQQQYLEDQIQLGYLQSEYARQEALSRENVNARKTLEKAKADYEGLKARLLGERAKLEMLNIDLKRLDGGEIVKVAPLYAPISGFVTQVNVNIGSHTKPEDVLFRIADTGHLHAELTVYEQDVPSLAIGQVVRLRIVNESAWRNGTIHLIGREIGPDRSVKVHVHLDTEDHELIPGTFIEAEIEATRRRVMALPEAAIVEFEGKNSVFTKNGDASTVPTFQIMEVEVGVADSGYREVMFPPNFDLQRPIVVHGSYDLLAKMKNIEEEE